MCASIVSTASSTGITWGTQGEREGREETQREDGVKERCSLSFCARQPRRGSLQKGSSVTPC